MSEMEVLTWSMFGEASLELARFIDDAAAATGAK
jgi:hypothetical protein